MLNILYRKWHGMEPKSTQSQEMINTIKEIMILIEHDYIGKEEYYYSFFERILERLNKPHDLQKIAKDIMPIFGGMGTFNDLILHQNEFSPLIEENRRFSKLKTELFLLCKQVILEN